MVFVETVLFPIVWAMGVILSALHDLTGSYGLAIIGLSLIVRSAMIPIVRVAAKAEARDREIQLATMRLEKAKNELPRQQAAMDRQRSAISEEKTKKLSHAPQMEAQLAEMRRKADETRSSIPTLERSIREQQAKQAQYRAEVAEVMATITRLRKEALEKRNRVPSP